MTSTNPQPPAELLRRTESYLSALHSSVARHDNLAANLGCAGCELRDQIRVALATPAVVPSAPADRAALCDRISEALLTTRRTGYEGAAKHGVHGYDARCALCAGDVDALVDAVLAALPAATDRNALERVRDYLEKRLDQVAVDPAEVFNILTGAAGLPLSPYYSHEACGFHWHGRDGMDIPMRDGQPVCPRCELRRVADEARQDQTQAPVDPWSIRYHRLGPAENNPAVCICGLGPEAVLHNEPPHRFNGRPKPGMPPVHGICTDCHHHETATCHTPAVVSQPETVAHIGGQANAEDCPACTGSHLPYPFICPGPEGVVSQPGGEA
ncbi:hypothetical protein [Streptomyces sp. NBC_00035]|uniref:hypothetical protein n=1 Tax=Streptomyces sp. NBC_00035 TaxID=2903614 RepID=UPI00324A34AD